MSALKLVHLSDGRAPSLATFSSAICSVREGAPVDVSSAAESRRGKTEPSDRAAVALLHRHRADAVALMLTGVVLAHQMIPYT